MKAKERLERLEQLCAERGVKLIYDDLQGEGGPCRLRESWYLIVNRRLATESRVRVIHQALERVPQRCPQSIEGAAATPPEPAPAVEQGVEAELEAAAERALGRAAHDQDGRS